MNNFLLLIVKFGGMLYSSLNSESEAGIGLPEHPKVLVNDNANSYLLNGTLSHKLKRPLVFLLTNSIIIFAARLMGIGSLDRQFLNHFCQK